MKWYSHWGLILVKKKLLAERDQEAGGGRAIARDGNGYVRGLNFGLSYTKFQIKNENLIFLIQNFV